jgi:hypothetical protein
MNKIRRQEIWQAISCLLCFIVAWTHLDDIGASEFSGGWLTGPLFKMADYGCTLFFLSLFLTFFSRRIVGVTTIVASLLCLPFYLYFLTPGPFRRVFRGEYGVSPQASLVGNTWAIAGILSLLLAIVVSLRCLAPLGYQSIPAPAPGKTP